MKNRQLFIYIFLLAISFLTVSCYKDKSTEGSIIGNIVFTFPDNYVQKDGSIRIEASNGSILNLEPIVEQKGVPNSDLSYEWEVSLYPVGALNTTYSKLSENLALSAKINQQPSVKPYMLVLKVTDNRNGIVFYKPCYLYVSSGLGDGVIIADTKDNVTGDLSLVRSKLVSKNYTGEIIYKRDFYSLNNNTAFDGIINQVQHGIYGNYSDRIFPIYVSGNKQAQLINSSSYTVIYPKERLFLGNIDGEITNFGCSNNCMYAVCGEDIFFANYGSPSFGDPLNYVKPSLIASKKHVNKYVLSRQSVYTFVDETSGIMYSITGFGQRSITPVLKGTNVNAYDPAMFSGYKEIGSFVGKQQDNQDNEQFHIMERDGSIGVYGISSAYNSETGAYEYITSRACQASGCEDIANAIAFEGCYSRDIFYYATKSKVYACIIGSNSVSEQVVYSAESGNEITCIKMFREPMIEYFDNTTIEEELHPGNDNQLMIAVYNTSKKEGTLHILPITSASGILGAVNSENTYTGFGKITALGTQSKQ